MPPDELRSALEKLVSEYALEWQWDRAHQIADEFHAAGHITAVDYEQIKLVVDGHRERVAGMAGEPRMTPRRIGRTEFGCLALMPYSAIVRCRNFTMRARRTAGGSPASRSVAFIREEQQLGS